MSAQRDSGTGGGAELAKLAHQLGVPTARLKSVADVPSEDLRALRHQIADVLFEAGRHHFTRMATLASIVPVPVSARIGQHVLPPLLAARTAEVLDPHRAAELVARMSSTYLADVAAAIEPGRAPHVIAALGPPHVALVGAELARRGEWIVVGAFVSFVSDPALRAAIAKLDGEQLLHVAFVLEDVSRIDVIGALLSPQQLDELLAAAATQDMWSELDELLSELGDTSAARLADRFAAAPERVQARIVAAHDGGELSASSYARLAGRSRPDSQGR